MSHNLKTTWTAWATTHLLRGRLNGLARLILLSSLLVVASPSFAQPRPHIDATIVAASDAPKPGKRSRIAIRMTPQPGWHGYWVNPGDSGLSVEARWRLPDGVRVGPLQHPAPALLELGGLASYVHKGAFTLLADLNLAPSVAHGTALPVEVDLSWLACSDTLCVPERKTLQLRLVAGDGAATSANRLIFSTAEKALPRHGPARATILRKADRWEFEITGVSGLDAARARLFPSKAGWFEAGAPQQAAVDPTGSIRVSVAASGASPAAPFFGVLTDGRRSFNLKAVFSNATPEPMAKTDTVVAADASSEVELSKAASPIIPDKVRTDQPPSVERPDDGPALPVALIGAILGGLLLNLMPCVFPILSLKALSLAKSGKDSRTAKVEGIAYFAGSVTTTTLLGAILLGGRALGHDIGWSFQLQDPRLILLLMLLSIAIALNLAGLFEVRGFSMAGGRLMKGGWSGAFGTGALAAVIATPCSGPFLGVALGAALVLPAPATLAVFAGLGIGMALPFLAMAFVPALRRLLPKPGKWMATFRRLLAIPMLLTAIGLAWVLGRQSGVDGLTVGLLLTALAATGLWWAGLRQSGGTRAGLALVPVAVAALLAVSIELPAPPTTTKVASSGVEPFSERRLNALRAAGTPVFVDMTADWCLICQVNEQVAIDRPDTQAAFEKAGVVTLVGDWTRGDPAITRFLASHGRNSIPFYLFVTRSGDMRALPQILSSQMLIEHASTS